MNDDTRNNVIAIIILVGVAALVTAVVGIFVTTVTTTAEHSEAVIRAVSSSIEGNLSQASKASQQEITNLNLAMDRIVNANSLVTEQRGEQYKNLTRAIIVFNDKIENNTKVVFDELNKTNVLLESINNHLGNSTK